MPISRRATASNWRTRPTSRRGLRPPIGVRSSTTTARNRPARSWSIPMHATFILCCPTAQRFATARSSARRPGQAWPRLAARKNGRDGRRPRVRSAGSARFRTMSKAVQAIQWARALYLYADGKDTLYRIHGTNQPGWIGHAISSGCIRLTNEDVIDLYSRVKAGALVVVLGPKQGGSRVALADSR